MKTTLPLVPLAVSVAALLWPGHPGYALPPTPPYVLTEVAKVGDAVPGGATGEVFSKFFTPAVNNDGHFGIFAQTRDGGGIKRETFLNILGDLSGSVRLLTKGEVLAEAPTLSIRSLKNPAFNAQGSLGVIFRLGGTGATSLDDLAVGFLPGSSVAAGGLAAGNGQAPGSPLRVVARENGLAPGSAGLFKSFKTVALGDQASVVATASGVGTNGLAPFSTGTLFFSASLKRVVPSITSANDYGVWTYSDVEGIDSLLLEGNTYNFNDADHVLKAFKTLTAPSLGFAQGHSVRGNTLVALARFTDTLAVVKATQAGSVQPVVSAGDLVPDLTDVTYKSFGIPSLAENGATTVLTKLSNKTFRITSFLGENATTRLNSVDPVPGITGTVLTKVRDPQVNAENDFVTLGKISDRDSASSVVTSQTDEVVIGHLGNIVQPPAALRNDAGTNGLPPAASYEVFAREGAVAPGAGPATFDKFRSVLLPDRELGGVLISASLTVDGTTVTSANNDGIWGFTSGAGLQKIVREGDVIDFGDGPVTVTKILAFKRVSGSGDHQRSGGASGQALILLRTLPAAGPSIYRVVAIERGSLVPL